MRPSASCGKPCADTFGYHSFTLPSGPMITPTRAAFFALVSEHAPYARPSLRSVSQINGKLKLNFFANAAFSSAVSKLAPRTAAPFLSYSALRSRNPQPSAVQPGVSALGKNHSTTVFPL